MTNTLLKTLKMAATAAVLGLGLNTAQAADPDPANWNAVVAQSKGQTVYFNAWGGATNINDYIAWAAGIVKERYGVTVEHVKLDDTANAVATVIAEKTAGRDEGGSIDLIWINGENFASMKDKGLMFTASDSKKGWAEKLPSWAFVDFENNATIQTDFTIPVAGLEAPWGGAKLVFFHDTAREKQGQLPDSFPALVEWAKPIRDVSHTLRHRISLARLS